MQQVRRSAEERLRAAATSAEPSSPPPEPAVSRETSRYLPMQNVAKIRSSTSSTPTAPVMPPIAPRRPGAGPRPAARARLRRRPAPRQRAKRGLARRPPPPGAGRGSAAALAGRANAAARTVSRSASSGDAPRPVRQEIGDHSAGSGRPGARSILLTTRIVAVASTAGSSAAGLDDLRAKIRLLRPAPRARHALGLDRVVGLAQAGRVEQRHRQRRPARAAPRARRAWCRRSG